MRRPRRYGCSAPFYDVMSAERPIYRVGRVRGIEGLDLRSGDRVLDVGCGTGLNFSLLQEAIGDSGQIIGIDASATMLHQAARRAQRHGWSNVDLVQADATCGYPPEVQRLLAADPDRTRPGPGARGGTTREPGAGLDAILFTYSLSLMSPWHIAWAQAVGAAGPGARVAVVDLMLPSGPGRILRPLARLACTLGGSDIHAHPWTALERDATGVSHWQLRAGHIQVRAGALRPLGGPRP